MDDDAGILREGIEDTWGGEIPGYSHRKQIIVFSQQFSISLVVTRNLPVPVTLISCSSRRSTTWGPAKPVAPVSRAWLGKDSLALSI